MLFFLPLLWFELKSSNQTLVNIKRNTGKLLHVAVRSIDRIRRCFIWVLVQRLWKFVVRRSYKMHMLSCLPCHYYIPSDSNIFLRNVSYGRRFSVVIIFRFSLSFSSPWWRGSNGVSMNWFWKQAERWICNGGKMILQFVGWSDSNIYTD